MSAVLNDFQPVMAPHKKLKVSEYHLMGQVGILHEDDRIELIEGEIINMSPIGPFHSSLASLIFRRLGYRVEGRAIPWSQSPIHFGLNSEPQPDFALLRHRADGYRNVLPKAADVLLLVEIADSSVYYDREVKLPLYARHSIPEYWIINIPEQRVEIYSEPDIERARYRQVSIISQGVLAPACFPDVAFDVGEIFG
jgi:Uma2 family endonuclease